MERCFPKKGSCYEFSCRNYILTTVKGLVFMKFDFSVLMSLYYKEQPNFLNDCLDSLARQILPATEIVIIYDGVVSLELKEVVTKWQTRLPIKVVALPENVGLGKALNIGLKHCSYKWVFRMDTDDICTEDRFEKQAEFITGSPNVVLVGSHVLEFDELIEDAKVLKSVPITALEIHNFALKRNPFNHMTVAYDKEVIESVGSYQHHMFMEDYNLWLRIIAAGYNVANIDRVLVYARVGNGMHARRRGWSYIQSEKKLRDLKIDLKMQSFLSAYIVFVMRSIARLAPSGILGSFYNKFFRNNT